MTRVAGTSLALLFVCLACSLPDRTLAPTCLGRPAAKLDDIFQAHLLTCTANGCHGTGQSGLVFKTAHQMWAGTVNVPSVGGAGEPLVTPGNLAKSYLFQKLSPGDPLRMPEGGPYLDQAALDQVAGWICAGAPEPAPDDTDGGTPDGGDDVGPVIDSFNPTSGVVGTEVTILGERFATTASSDAVLFGTTPAVVSSASATTLVVTVPEGATSGPVTVIVDGISATSAASFEVIVPNPEPTLDSITPSEPVAGGSNLSLEVDGTNFIASSVAELDGEALATTFVDDTHLTAVVPAASLAHAGHHTVTVVTPGPGGGTTSGVALTVDNPAPALVFLTPDGTIAGSGDVVVTAHGEGFVADTRATMNGADADVSVVDGATLTFTIPASAIASPAVVAVAIINPAPGGGTSGTVNFTAGNPTPVVASATPSSVIAGSSDVTVTLEGSGFVGATQALVDGSNTATTFVDATHLTLAISSRLTAVGGPHVISARNPAPGGGTSGTVEFTVENPAPTITSLTPSSVSTDGAPFTIRIEGSGFNPATTVTFDGLPIDATLVDGSQLTALLPTITQAGAHPIAVTNPEPGGGEASADLVATPSAVPSLTGFAPSIGTSGETFSLTLSGANFLCPPDAEASVVVFDGASLTPTSCSATELVVSIAAKSAGTYTVTVENGSRASDAKTYEIADPNPTPTLTSLSPDTAVTGAPSFTLSLTGTNFVAGSIVRASGASRATTFVSPTQLTATISATDLASAGTRSITVFNPLPAGGESNAIELTVVDPNPVPSVTSLSPSSAIQNSGATTVTVDGSGFIETSQATFDGAERATHFVSSTQLTVDLTDDDLATPGAHGIVVTNAPPGGGTSASVSFTVIAPNPVPTISTLSPTSALAGASGVTLTVTGTGFVRDATSVTFNGLAKTAVVISPTQLTITLSSADLATAGDFAVVVVNGAPGGGSSESATFEVDNPAPVLDTLSPSSVTVGAGPLTLTVRGSGFVRTSVVSLEGSSRTTHFVSTAQLTADLLSSDVAALGTDDVTVSNPTPGGGASEARTLSVTPPPNPVPAISSLTPCGAVAGGGAFTMTIDGTGFMSGSSVTFDGTPLTPVTFVGSNELSVSVPASLVASAPSNDAVSVVVTNPAPGGGDSNAFTFGVASRAVTLSRDVQPILTLNCSTSGCRSGAFAAEGMDLSLGHAFANTVGVASFESSAVRIRQCGPLPGESYLIGKITGQDISGVRMPDGAAPLSSADVRTIVDWAAQGAPE